MLTVFAGRPIWVVARIGRGSNRLISASRVGVVSQPGDGSHSCVLMVFTDRGSGGLNSTGGADDMDAVSQPDGRSLGDGSHSVSGRTCALMVFTDRGSGGLNAAGADSVWRRFASGTVSDASASYACRC